LAAVGVVALAAVGAIVDTAGFADLGVIPVVVAGSAGCDGAAAVALGAAWR
jgi:hypothetical protein